MIFARHLTVVLFASVASCSANVPSPEGSAPTAVAPDAASASRFSLCLTNGIGIVGYTYEDAEKKRAGVAELPCVAVLTESDVEAYRVDETPKGAVDIVLTEEASRRVARSPTSDVCEEGLFEVSLDRAPLFIGQCYPAIGAAGLDFPVIHVRHDGARVILEVRAQQAPFVSSGLPAARMDPPALRELFTKLGKTEPRG